MTRAPLSLLLCTLFASAPLVGRAGDVPPSPLGDGNPCFAISADPNSPTVSAAASFGDPNDPEGGFFTHLPDCASVCKKAGLSCAKFAKRAAACAEHYASDRALFNVKVSCAGLVGVELKSCIEGAQAQRATERQSAADALANEVTACTARATNCAGKCDAAP